MKLGAWFGAALVVALPTTLRAQVPLAAAAEAPNEAEAAIDPEGQSPTERAASAESAASAEKPVPAEVSSAGAELPPEASAGDMAFEEGLSAVETGPTLDLYGFADFHYTQLIGAKDGAWRQYVAPHPSFYVGHLNLYLGANLSESWRSLAEVRFTYAPNGDGMRAQPDGSFYQPDTSATDYAELQRVMSWGAIEIQRAWLEYQPLDFLTIRAGQWLTPYGYWNDDHGSPTIIGVFKPFPINDQFFPEHQTGLQAYGKVFAGSASFGYFLTLSNGRGPFQTTRDLDDNKAVGGRLFFETTEVGNLTVGLNGYRGRYTASERRYSVDTSGDAPAVALYRSITAAYDELSLGVDARLVWGGLHAQTELLMNEAVYDDAHRPATDGFDPRPTFMADYRRFGGYFLLGYTLPWWSVMPYAITQYNSFSNSDAVTPVTAFSFGINVRPTPNVVLKVEGGTAIFSGLGSTGLGGDIPYFATQAAWAF